MKLEVLLRSIESLNILQWEGSLSVSTIAFDSRKVEKDTLFVAQSGTQVDGHEYIEMAIHRGASVIVCENFPKEIRNNVTYIQVRNSSEVLGLLASNFYDNPSLKLNVVGITGTNGKTSTTTLLYQLFTQLGYKVGLLSTIQIKVGDEVISATHTTPDALNIQGYMRRMVDAGCSYCFMEVSSHAIDQRRIAGIQFRGAVFTNITHDHLDYHKTFANYLQAKKKFFDDLSPASFSLVNVDDKNGKVMTQNSLSLKKTYAMHSLADYTVKVMDMTMSYMSLRINGEEIFINLTGEFNAYNILAVYATALELGMSKDEVMLNLSKIKSVEGRIEVITSKVKRIQGVIDYAHTPDAVEKVLVEISKRKGIGKLITVLGCGGNRDKYKRPLMAAIASQYSDRVILTSDNPRDEDPKQIIEEMKAGIEENVRKKSLTVIDRNEAIKSACMLADSGDIIAILGKGHEKYQEIKGERFPFDDKEELNKQFELLGL